MKSVFPSKEAFFYFSQNKNQRYKPLDKGNSNKPDMTLGWGSNIVYIKDGNDNYFYNALTGFHALLLVSLTCSALVTRALMYPVNMSLPPAIILISCSFASI